MEELVDSVLGALRRVPWLDACGPAAVQQLATVSHMERLNDGKTVAWRGKKISHLMVVATGALEMSMTNAEGKRHVLSWLKPGQVLGLIPLIDQSTMIHDACVRGESQLVLVPESSFLVALQEYPALSLSVMRLLCERARRAYELLADHSLLPLPTRLARLILHQLHHSGSAVIAMSQSDLANMLGVARQSLNVELKQLENAGVIALGRGRIELRNDAELQKLAHVTV
jgi:CRP-like cAMP-binding protein